MYRDEILYVVSFAQPGANRLPYPFPPFCWHEVLPDAVVSRRPLTCCTPVAPRRLVCFFEADKTPIEVAQEAFKLGKKLKRSAAVVRELLERVSWWLTARGRRFRVWIRAFFCCSLLIFFAVYMR